jgi:hypothetical protein
MNKSPTKTMSWLRVLLGVALLAGICPQLTAAMERVVARNAPVSSWDIGRFPGSSLQCSYIVV